MQYIGGKQKSGGAQIAAAINGIIHRRGLQTYVEPFCGGLSVTSRVRAPRRHASDACAPLVCLYRHMQRGWIPPKSLDKEEWTRRKANQDPTDPMTAFAGIGCSFGGKWFGSYAARYKYTDRYVTAAEAAARSLSKKLGACSDVAFSACDYTASTPGDLVYCDPPYAGTMGYPAVDLWDPERFWEWAATVAQRSLIAVSEMTAPNGWRPLLEFAVQHRIATGGGAQRIERLYVPTEHWYAWQPEQRELF